jgi:hypothetical protein
MAAGESQSSPRSFPSYFVSNSLRAVGWPRRQGLLRRVEVVDRRVLNTVIVEMVKTACALGAGRPHCACHLLAHLFGNRRWEAESTDELIALLVPPPAARDKGRSSWEVISDPALATSNSQVRWRDLGNSEIQLAWSAACSRGLARGLVAPELVSSELDHEQRGLKAVLPEMRQAGLDLPPDWAPPSCEQLFSQAEELVKGFELLAGPLPPIPPALEKSVRIRCRLHPDTDPPSNPPFDHLRTQGEVLTTRYESMATLLHQWARALAERFAGKWSIAANEDLVHFYYDLFLALSASALHESLAAGGGVPSKEVFSACLDGIHYVHFGQPSQRVVGRVLELLAAKDPCYLASFTSAGGANDLLYLASPCLQSSMGRERDAIVEERLRAELLGVLTLFKTDLLPLIERTLKSEPPRG